MEVIWVILSVLCTILGISSTIKTGLSNSYVFFILAVVALLMFFLRRQRRKKYPINRENQPE